MNKKIILLVVIFLLLVPFRLPIGVLFIRLVIDIASLAGQLSSDTLVANVTVTKGIYNLALAILSVYNVERLIRDVKGREPLGDEFGGKRSPVVMYWQTVVAIVLMAAYVIFDTAMTYSLYFELVK